MWLATSFASSVIQCTAKSGLQVSDSGSEIFLFFKTEWSYGILYTHITFQIVAGIGRLHSEFHNTNR